MLTRTAEERARIARRIVTRAGFCFLVAASAAACIFDQGPDYKGGGRRNSGADINPVESTTATTGEDGGPTGSSDTGSTQDTGGNPLVGGG